MCTKKQERRAMGKRPSGWPYSSQPYGGIKQEQHILFMLEKCVSINHCTLLHSLFSFLFFFNVEKMLRVRSKFSSLTLLKTYLTIHCAVPSNIAGVATFVNLADTAAQYAPLTSISPPACMVKAPSGVRIFIRKDWSLGLKIHNK